MTFAEKLVFLMELTATSNKQLAEAVNVDPSLISRLRNARRDAPKNLTSIKAIADYFSKKCEGNYQRIALSEAMNRKHLQLQMDSAMLSDLLFDWLTDARDQVGQFLNTFERFSVTGLKPTRTNLRRAYPQRTIHAALPITATRASAGRSMLLLRTWRPFPPLVRSISSPTKT